MRGNNFYHANKVGEALAPQVVGAAVATGATISEPWQSGRIIAFLLHAGVVTGSLTWLFEVQQRSDDVWKDIMDAETPAVDITVLHSASEDNVVKIAEVSLEDIDSDTYKAIRITCTGTNAADAAGASYVLADLHRRPGGDANDLTASRPYTYEA